MKYNYITELPYTHDDIFKGELYIDRITAQDLGRKANENYDFVKYTSQDDYMQLERNIVLKNFQPEILQNFTKNNALFFQVSSHYYGNKKRIDFVKVENLPKLDIIVQREFITVEQFQNNKFQKYQYVDVVNQNIDYFKQFGNKINDMLKKNLKIQNLVNWKQELDIQPSIIKTSILIKSDYELANQFFYDLGIQLMEYLLIYQYKNLILFYPKWRKTSLEKIIEQIQQKDSENQFKCTNFQPIISFDQLKVQTNFFICKDLLQKNHFEDVEFYLDVIKQGKLFKKGEGPFDFGWNQRYFVLKGNYLYYYEQKEDQSYKGKLNILNLIILEIENKNDKFILSLDLQKKNRIIQIASSDQQLIKDWRQQIINIQTKQFQFQIDLQNQDNQKLKTYFTIPDNFQHNSNDWEFYKVRNNIKFYYQKKDLDRFQSIFSFTKIKNKFEKQYLIVLIAFLLAFKFIGLIFSLIISVGILAFKLKNKFKKKLDDKIYIKGETIIKGQKENLLSFMQNSKNFQNWNNNITKISISKDLKFEGKLRVNLSSIKGFIKLLKNGIYISYQVQDKSVIEVEEVLILNSTLAPNYFIIELVIKTNIKKGTSFKNYFTQLENKINTLSFFKNNFKYKDSCQIENEMFQKIQNEESQYYLQGEPFLEKQLYQFDLEKQEIASIRRENSEVQQIPIPQHQQLSIQNIENSRLFLERFIEENLILNRNLLNVNFPTSLMTGKSIFQILAEMFRPLTLFASFFQDCENEETSFYYLIAGILGGLFQVILFKKIPFIPFPGETAQYIFPDNSILNFEMLNNNQLAFLLFNQNTGFLAHGKIKIFVKFGFNHIKVIFAGKVNVYPGERSSTKIHKINKVLQSNNYLEIQYPELCLGDLMSGQLNWYFQDKLSISMPSKQIRCYVHFNENQDKIWEHFKIQQINGYIVTFKNDLLKEISGQWPFYLSIDNQCVWKNILQMPNYERVNRFLPSDSSVREDIIEFNNENLNQQQKQQLELKKFTTQILKKNIKNQFKQQFQ